MSQDSFTAEEMAELRKLLEVEKIRKVKNMYSQLMDARDIDGLTEILTEDAICEYGPYGTWNGKAEIHAGWKQVFEGSIPYGGFHATTNMWIEMTGPDTAISRSYLHDISNEPDPRTDPVVWYGIYDEDYRKVDGQWKVCFCRLQFLWPKRLVADDFPRPMTPSSLG